MAEYVEDATTMQYIGVYPYPIAPWPLAGSDEAPKEIDILDVRANDQDLDMATEIKSRLQITDDDILRSLPSILLWNERGMKDFEAMTATETYLMEKHADDIAMSLLPGTIVIDIQSGWSQKTKSLLEAIESHHKIVDYYALGMDRTSVQRIMRELDPGRFNYVRCHGLIGTHEDARTWIAKFENKQRPVCVLSLGGDISSMNREETAEFWRKWSQLLTVNNKFNSNNARIILGLNTGRDTTGDAAPNDNQDAAFERLIHVSIENANDQLGYKAFNRSEWIVEQNWNALGSTCAHYLVPKKDVAFENVQMKAGEEIFVAQNHIYDQDELNGLMREYNLKEVRRYVSGNGFYGMSSRSTGS